MLIISRLIYSSIFNLLDDGLEMDVNADFKSNCIGTAYFQKDVKVYGFHVNRNWFTKVLNAIVRLFAAIFGKSNKYYMFHIGEKQNIFRVLKSRVVDAEVVRWFKDLPADEKPTASELEATRLKFLERFERHYKAGFTEINDADFD